MNEKLVINGQIANKVYNLRTTEFIYDTLAIEASSRGVSVNVMMNKALLREAKRIEKINKIKNED